MAKAKGKMKFVLAVTIETTGPVSALAVRDFLRAQADAGMHITADVAVKRLGIRPLDTDR